MHPHNGNTYMVNPLAPSLPPLQTSASNLPPLSASILPETSELQDHFADDVAGPSVRPGDTATLGITLPPPHVSNLLSPSVTQDFLPPLNRSSVFSPNSDLSTGTQHLNNAIAEGTSISEGQRQGTRLKWSRLSPNSNRLPRPSERYYVSLKPPELEIEDVTDWSTITFFTSLYLKYNHALSPIVHKPTFAHDLATRRDKTDRQFRSLLLGLGEYRLALYR